MHDVVDLIMNPPRPTFEKTRTKCPFYGFDLLGNALRERKGNQCGLKTDSHSPCSLQISGHLPELSQCTKHDWQGSEEDFAKMLWTVRVFPNEYYPKGQKFWTGLPLWWWFIQTTYDGD